MRTCCGTNTIGG